MSISGDAQNVNITGGNLIITDAAMKVRTPTLQFSGDGTLMTTVPTLDVVANFGNTTSQVLHAGGFAGDGSLLTNLPSGGTANLAQVVGYGNVTSNSITVGGLACTSLEINAVPFIGTGNVLTTNASTLSYNTSTNIMTIDATGGLNARIVSSGQFQQTTARGQPVYIEANIGGVLHLHLSENDVSNHRPTVGLALADYTGVSNGYVVTNGTLLDINIPSTFIEGSLVSGVNGDVGKVVYLSNTVGLMTVTRPTLYSDAVQTLGLITAVRGNKVDMIVRCLGRIEDNPNQVVAQTANIYGYLTVGGQQIVTSTNLYVTGNVYMGGLGSSANVLTVNGNVSSNGGIFYGNASGLSSTTDVTPGIYGNGYAVPQITIDSNGRVSSITNVATVNATFGNTVSFGNTTSNTLLLQNTGTGLVATGNIVANNFIITSNSVQLGLSSGQTAQSSFSVAIGNLSGQLSQNTASIAIGNQAGQSYQLHNSVAIGPGAGAVFQNTYAVALGYQTASTWQANGAVAVGFRAGQNSQNTQSISIGTSSGQNYQGSISVAIGYTAGLSFQGPYSVAIGSEAGQLSQNAFSISIGNQAGMSYQKDNSVAIGTAAGQSSQLNGSVAIGYFTAQIAQNSQSVAIGNYAGCSNQSFRSVAIGNQAGEISQLNASVAIGNTAGQTSQQGQCVSIGTQAGQLAQNSYCVAVGFSSGQSYQGGNSIGIGYLAGQSYQKDSSVAIGSSSGQLSQNSYSVSIGINAGQSYQNTQAIAIGYNSGTIKQNYNAVAVGTGAGYMSQGYNAVSVGYGAGNINQDIYAISIGANSGGSSQNNYCVSIGFAAGMSYQNAYSVAIGSEAGRYSQDFSSVAIGQTAGQSSQGFRSVAIGYQAGQSSQDNLAVAVGLNCGRTGQGSQSICIGNGAGINGAGVNTIILANGSGGLSNTTAGAVFIQNMRTVSSGAPGNIIAYGGAGEVYETDMVYDTNGDLSCPNMSVGSFGATSTTFYVYGGNYIGSVNSGIGFNATNAAAGNFQFYVQGNATAVFSLTNASAVVRGALTTNGNIAPSVNNVASCGTNANKWTAVYAVNGTIQTSDSSEKCNVTTIPYGIAELRQVEPIMFQWNSQADLPADDPEKDSYYYGVFADQMDTLFPKLVYNKVRPYQLNYAEVVPICIKSIQDLDKKVSNECSGKCTVPDGQDSVQVQVPVTLVGDPVIQVTPVFNGTRRIANTSLFDSATGTFIVYGAPGDYFWTIKGTGLM